MTTEHQDFQARLEQLEQRYRRVERRFRVQMGLALGAVIGAILLSPANRQALAQGYGVTLAQLDARMKVVEAKTRFVSVSGTDMTISGANVHIVDGTGNTNSASGLGNLIIGYNSKRGDGTDIRTGSHNLILGDGNNFSSYGGLVAGSFDEISGPYATISGGESNIASGDWSSISGGDSNKASGQASSVNGGVGNIASGRFASVSGGLFNTASGDFSSISGGEDNTASGLFASVSGGEDNTASGGESSISGGDDNIANGDLSSVSGGKANTASGFLASISGGFLNTASGELSSVSGGSSNTASGGYDFGGVWNGVGPTWITAGFSGH